MLVRFEPGPFLGVNQFLFSPDPDNIPFDDAHRWLSVLAESVEMYLIVILTF
jgi:hypothetical protein